MDNFLNKNQTSELGNVINKIKTHNSKFFDSLNLNIIKKAKKNQQEIYKKTSFGRDEIRLTELEVEDLINKKLLKYISKKDDRLILTFKYILMSHYEIEHPSTSVNDLLNDLNKIAFEDIIQMSEEPLESREKVFITTLLGLGAISDKHSILVNDENQHHFKNAVECAVDFIKSLGTEYNDGGLDKLWKRQVIGETEVRAEIRRLNTIQPRTEGIYTIQDRRFHYLDILNDKNKLEEKRLEYLLARIFDRRPLTLEEKRELIKTLDKIQSYEYKIFKTSPPFDTLEIRKGIKHVIESGI